MVRKVDPLKKEIDALFETVPKKNQNLNDLLVDRVNENSADSDAYETGKGGNKNQWKTRFGTCSVMMNNSHKYIRHLARMNENFLLF